MKKVIFLATFILASSFFINHAYAVKKYNSSKSNTALMSIARNDIDEKIDEAKSEALEIVDKMLIQRANRSSDDKIKVIVKIEDK